MPGSVEWKPTAPSAPWLDEDLNAARSELFLAAMDLHLVFFERATKVTVKLNAAVDVVWGKAPHRLTADAVLAAWQLLFLAVPVVSTTFASFASRGAMFSRLEPESLGWLLIDEAGQVKPQEAVGAIWRSRRVLSVGDPRQLQPIVTMPMAAEQVLAQAFGVASTWMPSRTSVQQVADRTGCWGTHIGEHTDDELWVAAPLLVHRRCEDPMFSICNRIAYGRIMENANSCVREPDSCKYAGLPASSWIDVPDPQSGTKVQDKEIAELLAHIELLTGQHKVNPSDIFVVTPFRLVADRIQEDAFGRWPQIGGGTVHTVQGQEADVVILVLGGDPDKKRAREWVGEQPNLINVAVSRAKHRFYVIGDRKRWSTVGNFRVLACELAVPQYDSAD
ncbi:DEAD/DEAH box helicase [Mycobacteroides franklinii]|nr:AAA domain-containing protein [Mycobacteroides franklinii]